MVSRKTLFSKAMRINLTAVDAVYKQVRLGAENIYCRAVPKCEDEASRYRLNLCNQSFD